MATFVASSSANSGNSNVSSLGLILPGAWRPGLLALWVGIANSTPVDLGIPPGWTLLDAAPLTVGSSTLFVAVKVLGPREVPPTFTLSRPLKSAAALVLYEGANKSTPYAASASYRRPGSQGTIDAGPVTTTAEGQTVVALYAEKSSTATAAVDPAGTTRRAAKFGVGGGGVSVLVADKTLAEPGDSGVMTATYDVLSNVGYGIAVALIDGPPASTGVYQLSRGVLAPRTVYPLEGAQPVALPATWDSAGVEVAGGAGYTRALLLDVNRAGVMPYHLTTPAEAAATPGVVYRITGQARASGSTSVLAAAQFYRSDGSYIPGSLALGPPTHVGPDNFADLEPLTVTAPRGARRMAVAYGLAKPPAVVGDVRTNVSPNPSLEAGATSVQQYGPVGTTSGRDLTRAKYGSASFRVSSGGGSASLGFRYTGLALPPGTTWTASAYVYLPPANVVSSLAYQTIWRDDAAGVNVYAETRQAPSTEGEWSRLWGTFTVPAGRTISGIYHVLLGGVGGTQWLTGDAAYFDGLLIEEGATLRPYFDGSYSDTIADTAWVGTPHVSASTATSVPGFDVRNPAVTATRLA